MNSIKNVVLFSLVLLSNMALAHSGHDHNDPMSPLIHLLWLAPLFFAAWLLVKRHQKAQQFVNKQTQDKE